MVVITGALTGVVSRTPSASAAPTLDVGLSGPGSVLVGNGAAFTMAATNNTTTPGYNTGFRVVLPAGVSLSSSTFPATTFTDAPALGQTTLVWENINDSQPSAGVTMDFAVTADPANWPVGATFSLTGEAYTSDDPRVVPRPGGDGVMGSYTGSGSSVESTLVTAVTVNASEPSPEQELLRGVHDHSTVYTLTIENNPTNPTNSVTVEAYLPAGLEFLACGTVDNTTDAPTFAGNNIEYAGAPRLDASTPDLTVDCPSPTVVETVEVDPDGDGPLLFGVYTHLNW
ncbi:MAG: hypothetical protein OEZ14_17075, partial [Acidimicrobiia bacterium]|nr:hypothetical protein [Acidimicrobiia bacterium]